MTQQNEVQGHGVHVHDLKEKLENQIQQRGQSLEEAIQVIRNGEERQFGGFPALLEAREAALKEAASLIREQHNRVKFLQKDAIVFGQEDWYFGPNSSDSLWDRHVAELERNGRTPSQIDLVDKDSTIVCSLLGNPANHEFSHRGLVVGHVQSGKTGNIAAVINKAAETHYKFFVVLSGMTDQLRNQTQGRLDRDVVKLAPKQWMSWTTTSGQDGDGTNGDFAHKAVGGFSIDHRKQLVVMKKNAAILARFLRKLKATPTAVLAGTPFLIIDDECDQASINSANYKQGITRINDLIRKIIRQLPRVTYVGYTATPFANILIDPAAPGDLYPKHFIHALGKPEHYFGPEELFGREALEGEFSDKESGMDMIRLIPTEDVPLLRVRGGDPRKLQMPPSLESAIRYFLMVVAMRRLRGQNSVHNTMLVHTSMHNRMHVATAGIVSDYLTTLRTDLKTGNEELLCAFRDQWEYEQEAVPPALASHSEVTFDAVNSILPSVINEVSVHVENWQAMNRLKFDENFPKSRIVIGGNVLARGLTLEGLSVSYFLRASTQYDTLMQMGRWFGYRKGFEDLPRVWVEDSVRDAFFDLATVEHEIRRDIRRYSEEKLTPEQFAVRIRKIPGMAITARNRMRSAQPVEIGYSGTHIQTTRFRRRDLDLLKANWDAGNRLLEGHKPPTLDSKYHVFRNIPVKRIIAFLETYVPHPTQKNLDPKLLTAFLAKAAAEDPRMQSWTVSIAQGDGAIAHTPLGGLSTIRTVIRSAQRDTTDDAGIKALMQRRDLLVDLKSGSAEDSWDHLKELREQEQVPPLLVLYPIEAKSEPVHNTSSGKPSNRQPLNAVHDVLAYGIVFPGNKRLSNTYVAVRLPEIEEAVDEESDAEEEAEIATQLGGVDQP
jgi:hypothetical protein